ncbi:MAG: hypothetical protein RLZZ191_522 [Pseudomonadota bacterium]
MADLTHLGADGAAHMVDVSAKADTAREAVAEGRMVQYQKGRCAGNRADCRYHGGKKDERAHTALPSAHAVQNCRRV